MIEHQYVMHHINRWLNNLNQAKILDAGMGYGRWGYMLKLSYPEKDLEIFGVDVYEPAVEYAKKLGNAYSRTLVCDLERGNIELPDKWANLGVCVGVLAHLTKEGGLRLLSEMIRICEKVVVTAPTTLYQHTSQLNDPRIEPLRHKSAWSAGDFRNLGFNVRGFGWKGRTEEHTFLDSLTEAWTFRIPKLAGVLIAWKE